MVGATPVPRYELGMLSPEQSARLRDSQVMRWGIVLTLFLFALEFPYRAVYLPLPLRLLIGLVMGSACVTWALGDYVKLLVLFTAYAPWSKVFPATFGGMITGVNLTNVFMVAMLAGWFRQSFTEGRSLWRRRAVDIPLLIFVFLSVISLLRGELEREGGYYSNLAISIKRWLDPMLVFWIFLNNLRSRRQVRYVLGMLLVGTGLIALWGVKVYYIDMGGLRGAVYYDVDRIRIACIAGNPNQFGAFLCYNAFYLLTWFWNARHRPSGWGSLLFFLLAGRAMLLTFSRGTTLAFTAAAYSVVWMLNKRAFLLLLVPLTAFLIVNPSWIPGIFVGRFTHTFVETRPATELPTYAPRFGDYTLDRHSIGRIGIWYHGMKLVREHPFLGVGFDRFRSEIAQLTGGTFDSHNTYLTIAAEMGIPALVVFLWLVLLLGRDAWILQRTRGSPVIHAVATGFLAGLVGFAVSNLFGFRMNTTEIMFQWWIMAACVVRLRELEDEPEEVDPYA